VSSFQSEDIDCIIVVISTEFLALALASKPMAIALAFATRGLGLCLGLAVRGLGLVRCGLVNITASAAETEAL